MAKRKTAEFIVGLGASAGGLEALEHFFDGAPNDSGAAYVVVMHLSRDFKSMLDELLKSHTRMPVKPATHGGTAEANTIYVIQPATTIKMRGSTFIVHERPIVDVVGAVTTIDDFFSSLASQWQENACAVVLSGSGSDGAQGIREVDAMGGFTCAQSPETAKFDSMPLAAIKSKAVRSIDSPEHLGLVIAESMLFPGKRNDIVIASEQETAFAKILKAVIGMSSIHAAQYKHSMFERRVRKRMLHLRMGSLEDYADLISSDPGEAQDLADMLLIGVTQFFRDDIPFGIIRKTVIPELVERARNKKKSIRVWVPGCATGQEAFTLAMLFAEALDKKLGSVDVQIFATDVQKRFLAIGARGEFTPDEVGSIPEALRKKYFTVSLETGQYTVIPEIRKMIVFAPHDILVDPPFTRLDMVSCRNMLIYFSVAAQQKILSGFAFGLEEKGVLLLGSSETVGAQREAFEFIDAKNRIFRRTPARRIAPTFQAPIEKTLKEHARLGISRRVVRSREEALQPAYSALLDDYAPPSLLISHDRELLHCFGTARSFLRPPQGIAHYDVSDMVDPAIRSTLIAGLDRALKDRQAITFSKIKTEEFPEPGMLMDIQVKPLFVETEYEPVHALVIIDESAYVVQPQDQEATRVINIGDLADDRIEKLELELERTREALQSTIEQIESTNEELQSSNEELMSSNEELQSTNEELSSVNEELYSVNSEYHRQNNELTQLSSHFDLLLLATEIGVIFLDDMLSITRFTELARDIFNLTDGDVGRPISNFRSPFVDANADDLMRDALKSDKVVEVEVTDTKGVPWLIRTFANKDGLGGGVLTLINIGRLRNAEVDSGRASRMLEAIQDASSSFFLDLNASNLKIERELGFSQFTGLKGDLKGSKINLAKIAEDDQHMFEGLGDVSSKDEESSFQARLWHEASQTYRYVNFIAFSGETDRLHLIGVDVDQFVRAQTQAEEREAVLEAVLKASPSLVSYVDKDEKYVYVNHAYEKQWSMPAEDIIGKTVAEFLPPAIYEEAQSRIKTTLDGKAQQFIVNNVNESGEGQRLSVNYEPVLDGDNNVLGFASDVLDVTKFYDKEDALTGYRRLLGGAMKHYVYSVYIVDPNDLVIQYSNKHGMTRLGYAEDKDLKPGTKITRLTTSWADKSWKGWFEDLKFGQDASKQGLGVMDQFGNSAEADVYASLFLHHDRVLAVVRVMSDKEKAAVLKDLEQKSQDLALSNRDLEQFASVVAHDLRAPLRHILQFGDLVQGEIESGDVGGASEYVEMIKSSASKMDEMVDGLLSYSQIGTQPPDFTTVSLKDCVNEAQDFLEDDIQKSGAKIKVKSSLSLNADKVLLIRLFQNLIENSIKYQKEGVPPEITVTARKTERAIKITVKDNGIGIPTTGTSDIFMLFKRLHAIGEYSGLGVGLAACKRIMELHNGQISLGKPSKAGCQFILEFPIKTD